MKCVVLKVECAFLFLSRSTPAHALVCEKAEGLSSCCDSVAVFEIEQSSQVSFELLQAPFGLAHRS